ncbi:hypothetical protein [Dyadobacter chenhuakuii]|uniref:Uncharacterized protein n=1 Tax=Dyadobacter chenhuakuii TaxID=2909339 RepID=A0A9X1QGN0_9BACT|nr:hypothetical protein [Dyadobacter chenhuakuii]MCF2501375.1 hypothetical protein [Dyadobacter chenhuakuii]
MKQDRTIHWDPMLQARQAAALAALPEDQRDFMAFMFRTTNVSAYYYNQHGAEPCLEDFADWLECLDPVIANKLRVEGFERHRSSLSLRRHAAERKDLGLDEYMREHLSEQDYNRWKQVPKTQNDG